MASALSSSMKALTNWPPWHTNRLMTGKPRLSSLSLSTSLLVFSRPKTASASSATKKDNRSLSIHEPKEEDDAFEALFKMLEQDLQNDKSFGTSDHDDDHDITEEEFEMLQRELGLIGGEEEDVLIVSSYDDVYERDDDDEVLEEEEEEEERPLKLKKWQMRRLARALKIGRRKTSIKSLAAELCLDRSVVLELLRDPPPNLVMMAAALRDEPEPAPLMPQPKRLEILAAESTTADDVKSKTADKAPLHVMQQNWSARKRIKKVHLQTLERIYQRTKRPTNAMISSIVHVTKLPRKRVVKWFEDKRSEDGVPEQRVAYQRSALEAVSAH